MEGFGFRVLGHENFSYCTYFKPEDALRQKGLQLGDEFESQDDVLYNVRILKLPLSIQGYLEVHGWV